jgi:hypothetical protein
LLSSGEVSLIDARDEAHSFYINGFDQGMFCRCADSQALACRPVDYPSSVHYAQLIRSDADYVYMSNGTRPEILRVPISSF